MTSNLWEIEPFPDSRTRRPTREVEEFPPREVYTPYTTYKSVQHIYMYMYVHVCMYNVYTMYMCTLYIVYVDLGMYMYMYVRNVHVHVC